MPFIQFQFRRGTSTEWNTNNPVLANGELGIESNTNRFKLGNGTSNWASLPYGGVQGTQGMQGIQGTTGAINRSVFYFNAAANQTTFNIAGGYITNRIDVFRNGVKLQRISDYTDTSETDVVLTFATTENDLIEVVTYTSVPVMADVYSQAQSDSKYVNNQKLFAVNWIFGS